MSETLVDLKESINFNVLLSLSLTMEGSFCTVTDEKLTCKNTKTVAFMVE